MNLLQKLTLCYRILRSRSGNLYAHALRELPNPGADEMQAAANTYLRELVTVFSTQGHSGFSAAYVATMLHRLLRYEPLRPLTGEPDEWVEVSDGIHQNLRCSHVFKRADRFDGQAYDLNAVVFRDADGSSYTSAESMRPITFPYVPITEFREAPQ